MGVILLKHYNMKNEDYVSTLYEGYELEHILIEIEYQQYLKEEL